MTIDYQQEVIKYFCQNKESIAYIEDLDSNIFELEKFRFIFSSLKSFVDEYKTVPRELDLKEYFIGQAKLQEVNKKDIDAGVAFISKSYEPLKTSVKILEDNIKKEIQEKLAKDMLLKYAPSINNQNISSLFNSMEEDMRAILDVGKRTNYSEKLNGGFLLADHDKHPILNIKNDIIPLYLKGMNLSTAYGGIKKPELCIIMAPPKGFKTGNMLVMALQLVVAGFNVLYADTENGVDSIRTRLRQAMLQTDVMSLMEDEHEKETLDELVKLVGYSGADLAIRMYPMWTKNLNDVHEDVKELKEKHNWSPDIIIYDNLDNFNPFDRNFLKLDRRIKIQKVYAEAINLNVELSVPSITISQVNKLALDKEIFSMKDLAEDFGKAMIAHKAWGFCQTDPEKNAGVARMVSAFQREGKGDGWLCCFLAVDKETMTIREITEQESKDRILQSNIEQGFEDEVIPNRIEKKETEVKTVPWMAFPGIGGEMSFPNDK